MPRRVTTFGRIDTDSFPPPGRSGGHTTAPARR